MNSLNFLWQRSSGEAVFFFKTTLRLILLLTASFSFGQIDVSIDQLRSMPESQLLQYYNAAKAQGYSQTQIIELARLKGASPTELMELQEKLKSLQLSNPSATAVTDKDSPQIKTPTFGIQPTDSLDLSYSPVYGAEFFNNPKIQFSPSMQLATPTRYQLGPGDTLVVELYGTSASTYVGEISSSGTLSIEGIAPVYLSGHTLSSAKKKLTIALSRIYQGLRSTNPATQVQLEVNLQSARTILVQVVGQAKVPGTYALSGFSTPLHAIYAAGGINFNGSYRMIQLQRGGKTIETIDIYGFLSSGKQSKRLLRDGDILFIPYYKSRVEVMGAVKKRGLFEPLEKESLSQFQKHFGGFLPSADPTTITIDRQSGTKRKLLTFSSDTFDKVYLQNGDRIVATARFSSYTNKVSIEGAVVSPGAFALESTPTLGALLEKAGGLQNTAVQEFASLYRQVEGIEREIESFPLNDKILLQKVLLPGDRLVVYNQIDLESKAQITLEGAVKNPGMYPYFVGMQLSDAIALAGGLSEKADDSTISIYENYSDGQTQKGYRLKTQTTFSLTGKNPSAGLAPDDVIVIGINPRRVAAEFVEIQGEVLRPGKYLLDEINSEVETLIEKAKLSSKAAQSGIYILRPAETTVTLEGSESLQKALEESKTQEEIISDRLVEDSPSASNTPPDDLASNKKQDTSSDSPQYIKIPVNLLSSKNNLPTLLAEDIVIVEPVNTNITVKGGVQQPTVTNIKKSALSAKAYISAAGGFSPRAMRKNVFVISQNGSIRSTSRFLFFKFYPKVSPGATVVVPERLEDRKRTSFQELMGIATSLATFGIIIDRLTQ